MIDLKPACDRMIEILRGIGEDRLAEPTPCADYSVGDLVDHVAMVSRGFAGFARRDPGGPAEPVAGDRGTHRRDEVTALVRELGEAWADPSAWAGSSAGAGVELSNAEWGRIALTEMVVHGWDLARATGQAYDLADATLRACLDHVSVFVPAAPVPQLWGTPAAVPPDAPLLDRVLAGTGRDPEAASYAGSRRPT